MRKNTNGEVVDPSSGRLVVSSVQELAQQSPSRIQEQDGDTESGLRLRTAINQLPSHADAAHEDTDAVGDSVETGKENEVESAALNERGSDVDSPQVPVSQVPEHTSSQRAFEPKEPQGEAVSHEEVKSFFQNLMEGPSRRTSFSQRTIAHATWLGEVPVEAGAPEPDTSMDDSVERAMSSLRATPKLIHTTWLGEIES